MSTAICVLKKDLFPNGLDESLQRFHSRDISRLADLDFSIEHRSMCETNLDYVQIIPYITIYDAKTKKIFVYQRGKGSAESRLTGKCSIGLGGHMEIVAESGDIFETIAAEADRELCEEIGFAETGQFYAKILEECLSQGTSSLLYLNYDVHAVHLAVSFFVQVDMEEIQSMPHEADVITRGAWMSIHEIMSANTLGDIQLEEWSAMVLENMRYSM